MPCFPFYAINTNKDVYYSILMIWLTIFLIEFIENFKNKKINKKITRIISSNRIDVESSKIKKKNQLSLRL